MDRLGRFRLESFLGKGGSSEVYLAWDPEDGVKVALKLIPLDADPEVLEGEQRGAELQRAIQGTLPDVARVRELGTADGFLYISMEYISGPTLAQVLEERGRLMPHLAIRVAEQLCRVLETFDGTHGALVDQARPLIHGDLKPSNLRFEGRSRIRLLDFGLARRLDQPDRGVVSEFGSLPYASPERLRENLLTPAADLWSVAVILYVVIAGRQPFPGETDEAVRRRILSSEGPEPLPVDVQEDLVAILVRALAPEMERRFPNASALRRALAGLSVRPPRDHDKTKRIVDDRVRSDRAERKVDPLPTVGAKGASPVPSPRVRALRPDAPRVASGTGEATEVKRRAPRQQLPPPTRRQRWMRRAGTLVAILVTLFSAVQVYAIWSGSDIEASLERPDSEVEVLLKNYLELRRFDLLGMMDSLGTDLESHVGGAVESIIAAHRVGEPVARELWEVQAKSLEMALRIEGNNDWELARRAYCLGQAARGRGREAAEHGNSLAARAALSEALRHFRLAADRAPDWGAPYLAIASALLEKGHDQVEVDRQSLRRALERGAGRSGGQLTEAERQRLIEGYRYLGDIEMKTALQRPTEEKRADGLLVARSHFEEALRHCERSSTPDTCLASCAADVAEAETRLRDLGYLV